MCIRDSTGTVKRRCRLLDQFVSYPCQCDPYRIEHISFLCQIWRSRGIGADHRICQWCGIFCYRIQTGRTGVWYRLSDFRDCRTGNFVWDFYKLGDRSDLLDFKMSWDTLKMAENSQNLSYTDQIYSGLLKQLSGLFQHKKFGILLCI